MRQRLIISAAVSLFLMLVLAAVWNLCDWPPPRLILKYGFPPTGGPTGRTMTIEGVEFVELKPGYFLMGSHFLCEEGDLLGRVCAVLRLPWGRQPKHDSNECPPHWVEIATPFLISRTEVTNAVYARFCPEHFGERLSPPADEPVTDITWYEAHEFCRRFSERTRARCRLLTEWEWEFAARAGSATKKPLGDHPARVLEQAWCADNADGRPHPVGTRASNAWGLFDMLGNVWEWCENGWWDNRPPEALPIIPGDYKVIRGGSWNSDIPLLRPALRLPAPHIAHESIVGLRLALLP